MNYKHAAQEFKQEHNKGNTNTKIHNRAKKMSKH